MYHSKVTRKTKVDIYPYIWVSTFFCLLTEGRYRNEEPIVLSPSSNDTIMKRRTYRRVVLISIRVGFVKLVKVKAYLRRRFGTPIISVNISKNVLYIYPELSTLAKDCKVKDYSRKVCDIQIICIYLQKY